jgi:GntR family transcriptional regulator/MocR family aminotransferase
MTIPVIFDMTTMGTSRLASYNTDAGLHVSAFLPKGLDDRDVVREALSRGLYATALATCYTGRRARHGLVSGFAGASERRILAASRILGEIVR